ncbi:MAG: type II toxin-antitoxin system RelE/ParE family toxin [Gammaproteobacteria bacterium]|nr:type II toxin-antitoxin system RelE/ParE family toxin [Gammaproteobacteria bacterium]
MPNFRITAKAKEDLKEIAKFTEKNWGREKRNHYLKEFDQVFRQLAGNTKLGTECEFIRPGYRFFPVGSHLVFYKSGIDSVVEVIRINLGSDPKLLQ